MSCFVFFTGYDLNLYHKTEIMYRYLALLRGINVGGNNIIKMADLKASFEKMGFSDVSTYIQSGNVVFTSPKKDQDKLALQIEKALSETYNYKSKVALVSFDQMNTVFKELPAGFGSDTVKYKYDVIFLRAKISPSEVLKEIKIRPGVDEAYAGSLALYFSRLAEKSSQSYLKNVMVLPVYKEMTIRNWNTTKALFEMMGGEIE